MENTLQKVRWPLGCLLFFIFSCSTAPAYSPLIITTADSMQNALREDSAFIAIRSAALKVKTGDLITRTGNDFTSESLRSLNQRDKTYSHCGIASLENDTLFVYHALGGEWNPDQKLLRQPFAEFAEPYSNRGFGIYRFNIPPIHLNKIAATARDLYKQQIMFDMSFDLKTDDHMYCAEFVAKTFTKGTDDLLLFPRSKINGFEFIGVDDIFLHPACSSVATIVYK